MGSDFFYRFLPIRKAFHGERVVRPACHIRQIGASRRRTSEADNAASIRIEV